MLLLKYFLHVHNLAVELERTVDLIAHVQAQFKRNGVYGSCIVCTVSMQELRATLNPEPYITHDSSVHFLFHYPNIAPI